MEATQQLLEQWEPKIHRMLKGVSVIGWTPEELQQELRIEIVRAAEAFDPNRGAIFHTFLHTYMRNRLAQIINKATKNYPIYKSIVMEEEANFEHATEEFVWEDSIQNLKLSAGEMIILDLLLCGYTRREVKELCDDSKNFVISYNQLKDKAKILFNSIEVANV